MTNGSGGRFPFGMLIVGVALIVATSMATTSWERVRTHPKGRSIDVTGSAKKRIVSDQIEWSASIETQEMDRTAAYRSLAGHVQAALAYLEKQGIKRDEIRVLSADFEKVKEKEYVGTGEKRIEREIFKGYLTSQVIEVHSADVARIERVSREITQLLEQGVPISSNAPAYFYTKLGELKIEMLAAAARDARVRATSILEQTGGARLGKLRSADMGVININPANSTETSWEGLNDTGSLEKDILTVVHVSFEID
jgi:uncharacterized protein